VATMKVMGAWAAAGNGALAGVAWVIFEMTDASMHGDTHEQIGSSPGPIGWVVGAIIAGSLALFVAPKYRGNV